MKMLTGDLAMTKGRAFVNGFSLVRQLGEVRKEIGYCPQFDPSVKRVRELLSALGHSVENVSLLLFCVVLLRLLDLMTSREQLSMYARFHGLPEASIPGVVQKMLDKIGLSRFADKQCGTYSGGNKRKLSLAMALIGDPSVVFL
jgi:ATP-binding cassette subfamily A (ABC1) protein 3